MERVGGTVVANVETIKMDFFIGGSSVGSRPGGIGVFLMRRSLLEDKECQYLCQKLEMKE